MKEQMHLPQFLKQWSDYPKIIFAQQAHVAHVNDIEFIGSEEEIKRKLYTYNNPSYNLLIVELSVSNFSELKTARPDLCLYRLENDFVYICIYPNILSEPAPPAPPPIRMLNEDVDIENSGWMSEWIGPTICVCLILIVVLFISTSTPETIEGGHLVYEAIEKNLNTCPSIIPDAKKILLKGKKKFFTIEDSKEINILCVESRKQWTKRNIKMILK